MVLIFKIICQKLKTTYKIILVVSFLFLIVFCQKKKETTNTYKNKVIVVLNNLDSLPLKDSEKEKVLDTLSQFVLTHNNDSINRNLLFDVANKYFDINKPDKYFEIASKINQLATSQNDSSQIAKSFSYIGYYYNINSKLDSAFKYYLKAEKIYKALRDRINYGKSKMFKAEIYYDTGNFVESEIEIVNALKELNKTNDTKSIFNCYLTMALSLKEMNNYSKSLEYLDLALSQINILERKKEPQNVILNFRAFCFNSKGRIYEKEKKYGLAIEFYSKGLEIDNIKKLNPILYAMVLNNLAYSKMQDDNLKGVKEMLFESYKIRDSLKSESGIISSKFKIGEYYLYKKDTIKGLENLLTCYKLAKKVKSTSDVLKALQILSAIDVKNKSFYTNEYIRISDSSQVAERNTRNKFARIAYETDQVEEKNVVLSKTITNLGMSSGILILILGGFFIIYRLKSRNKELLFVKEQQEANEKIYQLMLQQQSETQQARNEERNRIAMELHDGIVNSIFTTRFSLMQLESESEDKKQQLVQELEKAESEIRRVSHDLKQNLLVEDKTILDILANLIDYQQNEFGTQFDLSVDKFIDWSSVSSDAKIHVYRIIQEALQNSNKYSKAKRCCVFLLKTEDKVTIRIWDNGVGFHPEKAKQGIGLKNIKERTKALNGELKISSEIGKGTTLEVIF